MARGSIETRFLLCVPVSCEMPGWRHSETDDANRAHWARVMTTASDTLAAIVSPPCVGQWRLRYGVSDVEHRLGYWVLQQRQDSRGPGGESPALKPRAIDLTQPRLVNGNIRILARETQATIEQLKIFALSAAYHLPVNVSDGGCLGRMRCGLMVAMISVTCGCRGRSSDQLARIHLEAQRWSALSAAAPRSGDGDRHRSSSGRCC